MRRRKEKSMLLLKDKIRFLGRPLVKILSSPFSSDDNFTFTEFPKRESETQHRGGRNSWCPRPSACFSARNGQILKNSDKKKVCAKFLTTFSCSLVTAIKLKAKEFFARPLQILKSQFHIIDTQRQKFLR
jgi:hypothetical protein